MQKKIAFIYTTYNTYSNKSNFANFSIDKKNQQQKIIQAQLQLKFYQQINLW